MNPPAKLSDLIDVLLLDSPEHVTRFDRHTGQIVSLERSILTAPTVDQGRSVVEAPVVVLAMSRHEPAESTHKQDWESITTFQ